MLINAPRIKQDYEAPPFKDDPELSAWFKDHEASIENPQTGVFLIPGHNPHFDFDINGKYLHPEQDPLIEGDRLQKFFALQKADAWRSSHGVCDNIEQAVEYLDWAVKHPTRRFIISLSEVRREWESEGGWRWHKWGPYIGKQEPQCEFMFDEPVIESVYCFQLLEIPPERTDVTRPG